jgi:hypothetical protein
MLASVDFYDQPSPMADEVHHVGADRGLSAEVRFLHGNAVEMPPEAPLGWRHATPQAS